MRATAISLASLVLAATNLATGAIFDECSASAVNVLSGARCCSASVKMRPRRHLFSRTGEDTCSDGSSPCCDTTAPGPPVVTSGGTTNLQCGRNYEPGTDGEDIPGGVTYTLDPCPNPGPYATQTCFHVKLTAAADATITDIHLIILDGSANPSQIPNGLGTWPFNQYCSYSGNVGNCWVPVSAVLAVLVPTSDSLCGQDVIVAAGISIVHGTSSDTCFNQGTEISDGGRWFMYTKVGFTCPNICTHYCCCPSSPPQDHWCDIGTAFGYKEGTPNFNGNPIGPALGPNTCKRWGWYFYVPASTLTASGGLTGTLIVGAGGNDITKGTEVGTFSATLSGTSLTVSYTLSNGFDLSEVHFYASCSKPGSCAPGSYTYPGSTVLDLSGTTDASFQKTITVSSCSYYYLIFHAKVNQRFPADVPCPGTTS